MNRSDRKVAMLSTGSRNRSGITIGVRRHTAWLLVKGRQIVDARSNTPKLDA